ARREGGGVAMKGPYIDWAAMSPLVALLGGGTIVLLAGLLRSRVIREVVVPLLTIAAFGTALGLGVWQWGEEKSIVAGALRVDELSISMTWVFCVAGVATVLLSWRALAPRE